MRFKDWLMFEMPIRTLQHIPKRRQPNLFGDSDPKDPWSKNAKRKYGWNSSDVGIVGTDAGITKFKKLWANTEHNFDFYLVRTKEGNKYLEVGEVTPEWVQEKLGIDIQASGDAITVIFTNNKGSDKMPFTAWTAAHRLGHVFQRSGISGGGIREYSQFKDEVINDLSQVLKTAYDYVLKANSYWGTPVSNPNFEGQQMLKKLATAIGTMQSARKNNLRVFFEFPHELLAQYLLTTSKIQFNQVAKQLITHYTWGNAQGLYRRLSDEGLFDMDYQLKVMADDYNERCKNILDAAVGRLFVM